MQPVWNPQSHDEELSSEDQELLAEVFEPPRRKYETSLESLEREYRLRSNNADTPRLICIAGLLLTAATWALGAGEGTLLPAGATILTGLLYLDARVAATKARAALGGAVSTLTHAGHSVEWTDYGPHVEMRDALKRGRSLLCKVRAELSDSNLSRGEPVEATEHTPTAIISSFSEALVQGAKRFRRHSIFNVGLILAQRTGARAIATAQQWQALGRAVCPDAVPIVILWPLRPVVFLYDVEDTLPPYDRASIGDPFAVSGTFDPECLRRLKKNLDNQKQFSIALRHVRTGFSQAGSASSQGRVPVQGLLPIAVHRDTAEWVSGSIPSWRITVSDRLTPAEQFVTLCHELGHIFCGHLGDCNWDPERKEAGWPDRTNLSPAAQEIEAETVAWIIAERAGLATGSKQYVESHAGAVLPGELDRHVVFHAANRIERLAKIRYA